MLDGSTTSPAAVPAASAACGSVDAAATEIRDITVDGFASTSLADVSAAFINIFTICFRHYMVFLDFKCVVMLFVTLFLEAFLHVFL